MTEHRAVTVARAPGYLYGGLAVVVMALLAVSLLRAPRTGVPAIAEIAPQATQQILDAPPEQSSNVGEQGNGGDGGGAGAPPDGDKPDVDDEGPEIPRIKKCVGKPPRQTEDPQSPPCIPYWDGDNGGDRGVKGIRGDKIYIAAPGGNANLNRLADHFNKRFTFYGRQLVLVDTSADRRQGEDMIAIQEAAAENADKLHKVFASTDYWYGGGAAYNRALADKGIIGVSYQPVFTEDELREAHPYLWQYPMTAEAQFSIMGEWMCRRVLPGPARHAGTLLAGQERKIGVVVYDDFGLETDTAPLRGELETCGTEVAQEERITAGSQQQRTKYQDVVLKMIDAEVTTIVCLCDSEPLGQLMQHASGSAYQPEWIVPTFTENEHVWMKRTYPKDQSSHMFGLHFLPMHRLVADDPWVWAATESDSSFGWDRLGNESSYSRQSFYHPFYRSLLLIASGIQMAGPNLTPETFARGLQETRFPNPKHPIMAGRVGFEGRTHSMTKDAAEWWWTDDIVGPYGSAGFQGQGAGTMCFVDGGARRSIGDWPAERDPFFSGPCTSGDRPAGGGG